MTIEWRKPLAATAVAVALCGTASACGMDAGRDLAWSASGYETGTDRGASIPTPAKTGPPLSRREAASEYLRIVEARNESMTKLFDVIREGEHWRTIRVRAGNLVTDNNEEILRLGTTNWPADVARDVEDLIRDDRRMGIAWSAISDAKSEREVLSAIERIPEGSDAAWRIRTKLGLPTGDGDGGEDSSADTA